MTIAVGAPIWVDLGTTDLAAAMSFYHEILGWNFTSTGAEFGYYQMVDVGVPVGGAALNRTEDGEPDPTMPAWFTVYLKVEDIDATLRAVSAHGGHVFIPPMQIGEMGAMAIIAAPSGAAVGLWQPGTVDGFATTGQPGTVAWCESVSTDFDADAAFYAAVFGWENAAEEMAGGRYVTNAAGDAARAGLMDGATSLPAGVPSHWQVTFAVADADATVAQVAARGGSVVQAPQDSPHGRYAVVMDPQGAPFGVMSLSAQST